MSQTLLALLAMATVTMLSINQQRTLLDGHRKMLDDEMEVMASGVALSAIEYIGTKDFDEATSNLSGVLDLEDAQSVIADLPLTLPEDLRCALDPALEDAGLYDACDDLADFNAMQWEVMPFLVGDDTVHFEVQAHVYYLDDDRNRTGTPSLQREVEVTVKHVPYEGQRALLQQPIRLTRTFTY